MQSRRPRGVSYLAALELAGGFLCIVSGIYYVNALDGIVAELGLSPFAAPDFYIFFMAEAVLGVLCFPLGFGLWKGKKWGMTLTLDISVASLVYYVGFGSYFVAQYSDYTELSAGVVGVAVALVAALYLNRPSAKAFFETGPHGGTVTIT